MIHKDVAVLQDVTSLQNYIMEVMFVNFNRFVIKPSHAVHI